MKKLGLLLTLFCLPTLLLACQKKPERTGGPAGPFYDHYFYQAFRDQLQIIDIADPANPGPAAVRATGRLCYASGNRAVTALGHLTRYAEFRRTRGLG